MSKDRDFPIPPCFDKEVEATERLTEMFVDIAQGKRIRNGQCPAQRAVFRKLHGVAHARFERLESMPKAWQVGIFAHKALDAWVRFSSDTSPTDPDLGSTLGMAVKLFGVPGEKALGQPGDTADLIMQNFPIFFLDNAQEMVEFTYAGVVQQDYPTYLADHPRTNDILNDMAATVEGSCLTTTYWAILPFHMGETIVKYRWRPTTEAQNVPDDADNYLATDLANRLEQDEYSFVLEVQPRTDPKTMPLDAATRRWPEKQSPWQAVARLVLPRQDVCVRGQADYGQSLSFNIWRVPEANAPVRESSIAWVRKGVYSAGAEKRHRANGQPIEDPRDPRPVVPPVPDPDDCIVQAVIYPSIGIARVGNSTDRDGFYIGPEVIHPEPRDPKAYRDDKHRLKREGARFRIYGVNAKGAIVRELSGPDCDAKITWKVQLANTKSAWYGFQLALDIPEAAQAPPTTLRNATVSDRASLAITPKMRQVSGAGSGRKKFDDGEFMGTKVYLGEIFTDEDGRLIVLGGHGKSGSSDGSHAITFANNEGWYDDVSDGPVDAEVVLNGLPLEVIPSWVVVAPPNYAPQRKSVRTMWDLMRCLAIQNNALPAPVRPSFTNDILPIFERMAGLQWVNAGFAGGFGWKGAFDLTSPEALLRLSSNGPAEREKRRVVNKAFRRFDEDAWAPTPWPWLYGDAMAIPPVETPRQNAALSDCQLAMLDKWAEGNFEADYDPDHVPYRTIEEVPLAQQGEMLTRAALEFCLADAFHPGCEMTWPVRTWTMYMQPFRFTPARPGWVPPSLGAVLTSDSVTIPNGPLCAQEPGGISRWMAVPWQCDTASCRSGYEPSYDPYVPTFWPARVPNQVLTRENYEIVMDAKKPMTERQAAFANRAAWIEPLGSVDYTSQINNMIHHFDHLGVVVVRDGPKDTDLFPRQIEVEDWHKDIKPDSDDEAALNEALMTGGGAGARSAPSNSATGVRRGAARSAADVDLRGIEKVRRFPGGFRR
jgi:L-lysine epsilon oxidase-like protein